MPPPCFSYNILAVVRDIISGITGNVRSSIPGYNFNAIQPEGSSHKTLSYYKRTSQIHFNLLVF